MKHIKEYPGLDHDFCRVCRYIPTEHYLIDLQSSIDKLVNKGRKQDSQELTALRNQLKKAKAIHDNHQWSL